MFAKYLVGATLAAAVALPTSAQTTEYYVVQDTTSKRCTIVDQKPNTTTTDVVQVGAFAFKSRSEAEERMKKVCEP
jgi:hypothetical protein